MVHSLQGLWSDMNSNKSLLLVIYKTFFPLHDSGIFPIVLKLGTSSYLHSKVFFFWSEKRNFRGEVHFQLLLSFARLSFFSLKWRETLDFFIRFSLLVCNFSSYTSITVSLLYNYLLISLMMGNLLQYMFRTSIWNLLTGPQRFFRSSF